MSPCSKLAGDRRGGESGVAACSVPSPASSPRRKTIEDVWSDFSLSFFRHGDTPKSIPAAIVQDFMPEASKRSPTFPSPATATLSQPPATCLTLASGCTDTARHDPALYALLTTSSGPNHTNSGKRSAEMKDEPPDQRHKRLIKNRESAARSRARRQAYTTELEMEIERLKMENAYLRRRQEKFLSAVSSATPERNKLHRTLTGPF